MITVARSQSVLTVPSGLKTLLVDLDGTLLDVDMSAFLAAFFPLAAARFVPPSETMRVAHAMAAAARKMFTSRDPARTLDLVFLEAFAPSTGHTPAEVRARFAAFYRKEFERMRRLVRPVPAARPLIERARALGLELVLATNPVFFLDAIRARVRWAGLDDIPFLFITGAELMYATKPHAEYFGQVLALAGRHPEECLMVGDSPLMDMAAKNCGIPTWLVVRAGTEPEAAPLADRAGTLEELEAWLAERASGG